MHAVTDFFAALNGAKIPAQRTAVDVPGSNRMPRCQCQCRPSKA